MTDLNYRAKLWNYGKQPGQVMPELVEGCDVILGNEEDAEKHFGIHPESVDVTRGGTVDSQAYRSVCEQLMEQFPRAQKIITTLRGSISASHNTWSGVLYNGEEFLTMGRSSWKLPAMILPILWIGSAAAIRLWRG